MGNKYIESFKRGLNAEPADIRGNSKKKSKSERSEEEKIIGALSVVNSMTLVGEYLTGEEISDEEKNRVIEFMDFFLSNYGENEKLFSMIQKNWPDQPRIFRIYACISEDEETFEDEMIAYYERASKNKKKSISPYVGFILSHHSVRYLTYLEADCSDSHAYCFQEDDNNEEARFFISALLFYAKTHGGVVIYRRATEDCHTVYGLRCANGKIYNVPRDEMEFSFRNSPKSYGDIQEKYDVFPVIAR